MRRTGSEEIGSSKALGRAGMIPGLPRLLFLAIFLVELQSGGLGSKNTTMPGALCPASSSLLCFIGWSYPQIVLYSLTILLGFPDPTHGCVPGLPVNEPGTSDLV